MLELRKLQMFKLVCKHVYTGYKTFWSISILWYMGHAAKYNSASGLLHNNAAGSDLISR